MDRCYWLGEDASDRRVFRLHMGIFNGQMYLC